MNGDGLKHNSFHPSFIYKARLCVCASVCPPPISKSVIFAQFCSIYKKKVYTILPRFEGAHRTHWKASILYFHFLRQEAIKQAERERRQKYRKQDEEREVIRSAIREKYNLEKPINEDYEEEDEDDEYCAASRKQDDVEEDPIEGRYHSLTPDIFIEILFLEWNSIG